MKFGREPALIIGAVGSILTVLVAMNLPWIDAGSAAALMALITAGATAFFTRPLAPALFTGAFTAAVALFGEYGFQLSDQMIAALAGLILAGFALFGIRPQVSPVES